MKTTICLLITGFLLTTLLEARIGESEAEIVKRYGQPTDSAPKGNAKLFRFGEWQIQVAFYNGTSAWETYTHYGGGRITEDDVQLLLGANSSGRQWKAVSPLRIAGEEPDWAKKLAARGRKQNGLRPRRR